MRTSPTVTRRRLGIELRARREQAGLTVTDAGKLTRTAPSQITRYEQAQTLKPKPALVERLFRAYGVNDRASLELFLSWATASAERGWWYRYTGLAAQHELYVGLETEARVLRNFEPTLVPGLLQTPGYTEALIRGRLHNPDDSQVASMLALRAARQAHLLSGDDPLERFYVAIDEAVLYRPVGGRDVMIEQLEHLKKWAARTELVELFIIPLSNGAHAGQAPYTIITFAHPKDPEVVCLESPFGELCVESPMGVLSYVLSFEHLGDNAVRAVDNVEVIDAAIKRLARQPAEIGTYKHGWVDLAEVPPQ